MTFDELVAEGEAMPLAGWDFSWFEGRASEERPPWGYAGLLGERMARAKVALDVQTGGGEVVASIPKPPARLTATEAWPPNAVVAQRNLDPLGGRVVRAAEDTLPFRDGTFDLVTSRHPVVAAWPEISRVLAPGGAYFSQQVGAGSNQELIDFMMGPQPVSQARSPRRAVEQAEAAGLDVVDLREAALRVEFGDVGAVVHFLRKVLWTVPDFSAERYRERLLQLHHRIQADGPFVAHSYRFLVEARKRQPG